MSLIFFIFLEKKSKFPWVCHCSYEAANKSAKNYHTNKKCKVKFVPQIKELAIFDLETSFFELGLENSTKGSVDRHLDVLDFVIEKRIELKIAISKLKIEFIEKQIENYK